MTYDSREMALYFRIFCHIVQSKVLCLAITHTACSFHKEDFAVGALSLPCFWTIIVYSFSSLNFLMRKPLVVLGVSSYHLVVLVELDEGCLP